MLKYRSQLVSGLCIAILSCATFLNLTFADRSTLAERFVNSYQTRIYRVIDGCSENVVSLRQAPINGKLPPRNSTKLSGGSGVLIDAGKFVLTNDHVVPNSNAVEIVFADGSATVGVVWARDPVGDLALLKVGNRKPVATLNWAKTTKLQIGTPVVAIGNALGLSTASGEASVSFGIVSALNRYQGGERIYGEAVQFDAAVNPGNSGGALFNFNGEFIGITGRISTRGKRLRNVGVAFAIPAHRIKKVLPKLRNGEDIQRGYLGLVFDSFAPGPGLIVARVKSGSPAELSGFKAQDRILSANGKALNSAYDFMNSLSNALVGETYTFVVERIEPDGAVKRNIAVTLDRRRKRGAGQ